MTFYTDLPNGDVGTSHSNVLMGNRYEQAPTLSSIYYLDKEQLPTAFPLQAWFDQSSRYIQYWSWFNGDVLMQSKKGENGETLYKYPLHINLLRDMVRKHANLLFGELPDASSALVKAAVKPRKTLKDDKPTDAEREFAEICQYLVNEVWDQSNGAALQQEGGEIAQFLGGHVYQIAYEPWRKDFLIPLVIRSWYPDFVLPVYEHKNYWDLSEVFIVQRIESQIAKNQYGHETNGAFSTYVEHWTKKFHAIYLDGKPITLMVGDIPVLFDQNNKNPFGFVPFVYIPHLREGSFYGSSHIPDIQGLLREYNNSMAAVGDGVLGSVDRERYVVNVPTTLKPVDLPNGKQAVNLGTQAPTMNNPPDLFIEDPPQFSPGLVDYPKQVYNQFRRTANLPPVIDGEDEGSQRSGLTLDIRFYPATSHAKAERVYWEIGLNQVDKYILQMIHVHNLWERLGVAKPSDDFLRYLMINQQWNPQIPRDRESHINEILARLAQNAVDIDTALESFGDIHNIDETKEKIMEWVKQLAEVQAEANAPVENQPLGGTNLARTQKTTDGS